MNLSKTVFTVRAEYAVQKMWLSCKDTINGECNFTGPPRKYLTSSFKNINCICRWNFGKCEFEKLILVAACFQAYGTSSWLKKGTISWISLYFRVSCFQLCPTGLWKHSVNLYPPYSGLCWVVQELMWMMSRCLQSSFQNVFLMGFLTSFLTLGWSST